MPTSLKSPRASFIPFLKIETTSGILCLLKLRLRLASSQRYTFQVASVGFAWPKLTPTRGPFWGSAIAPPPSYAARGLPHHGLPHHSLRCCATAWALGRQGRHPCLSSAVSGSFPTAQELPQKVQPVPSSLRRAAAVTACYWVSLRGCSVNPLQGSNLTLSK